MGADKIKIRNKRLAKLGSQTPTTPSKNEGKSTETPTAVPARERAESQPNGASTEEKEQTRPKINISKAPSPADAPDNPFAQLSPKPTINQTPTINVEPANGRPVTPMKRERPSSASGRPSLRDRDSPDEWEDKILRGVFRLSLEPGSKEDTHGYPLHYVSGVREDLEEQGGPIKLKTGHLDQALLEAASNPGKESPLDYLLGCWKRVSRQFRMTRLEDARHEIIKEARRICMSYCIFAVSMPDMFG